MGDTAAILFDTDRGTAHRIGETELPGLFMVAHDHETTGTDSAIITAGANAIADTEAGDSLIANPWVQTLKQRVFAKIQESGWGEGIDILLERLDGRDFEEVEQVLRDLVLELPDENQPKQLLADFLLNHRGFETAEKELLGYIATEPENDDFRLDLAEIYRAQGLTDQALK